MLSIGTDTRNLERGRRLLITRCRCFCFPGSAVVVVVAALLPVLSCLLFWSFVQLKAAMTAYVQSRGLYIVHDKVGRG